MKPFKLNIHHESNVLQEYRQAYMNHRFYDNNSLVASPPIPEYRLEYPSLGAVERLTASNISIDESVHLSMDEINRAYHAALGRANRAQFIHGSSTLLTVTGVDVASGSITVDATSATTALPPQPPTNTGEYIAQRRQGTSRFSNFIQDMLPDSITRSRR
jgi:hypothetical protein